MFERLAKFRSFGLWPMMPQREAVRLQAPHCNDNRPGLRRPDSRRARPRQTLACHWSLSRDGRLECHWERETAGDRLAARPATVARLAGPSRIPAKDSSRDPIPDLGLAAS